MGISSIFSTDLRVEFIKHIDMYSKDERENIRSSQSYSDIVSVLQGKIG